MAGSRKKVIVRTIANVTLAGYLPVTHIVVDGAVELLDVESRVCRVPLETIKLVSWVRDFNLADSIDPERITRRSFAGRPRGEGLWLRITFTGGDLVEGLAALDKVYLDDLLIDRGLYLVPPDVRGNTQRIFVPHAAIAFLKVLGVITSPSARVKASKAAEDAQESLFAGQE